MKKTEQDATRIASHLSGLTNLTEKELKESFTNVILDVLELQDIKRRRSHFMQSLKITGGLFGAPVGLLLAFHAALLQFPEHVSSSLEDYMKNNDIPLELIDGVNTDNVRVYNDNSRLAAMYAGAASVSKGWGCHIEYCWPMYFEMFNDVSNNVAFMHYARDDEYMISMNLKSTAAEDIQGFTYIPVEDVEADETLADIFFYRTFVHEVAHAAREHYIYNQSRGYSNAHAEVNVRDFSYVEHTLSEEIIADLRAIQAIKSTLGKDISREMIYKRAIAAVVWDDITHASSVFLEEVLAGKNEEELPSVKKIEEKLAILNQYIYDAAEPILLEVSKEYPNDLVYKFYVYAMELQANAPLYNDLPYMAQRNLDLFVEGVEYFAPTKAAEIKETVKKIKVEAARPYNLIPSQS